MFERRLQKDVTTGIQSFGNTFSKVQSLQCFRRHRIDFTIDLKAIRTFDQTWVFAKIVDPIKRLRLGEASKLFCGEKVMYPFSASCFAKWL